MVNGYFVQRHDDRGNTDDWNEIVSRSGAAAWNARVSAAAAALL